MQRFAKTRAAAICAAGALAIGCGGAENRSAGRPPSVAPPPSSVASADERVIRSWADDLRAGRVAAASDHFAVPSTAANGTPPIRLGARAEVVAFNSSLPCGARLVRTTRRGRYTVGVFELTERRGGDCGTGTGGRAATAFRIRDGEIVEWLRIPIPPRSGRPPAPEPGAPAPRRPADPSETV